MKLTELPLIDDSVGKDKTARKHIRTLEVAFNELVVSLQNCSGKDFDGKVTEGITDMKRFTVGSSNKNSTENVLPPSDIPPTGTVDDYNAESSFVKVRDTSESGWKMVRRDLVDEFLAELGIKKK